MPSVLVSAIQERVRVLCDLPAFSASSPITSAMALDLVKVATELLAALVGSAAASELYFATRATLTTTPNVATVSLPVLPPPGLVNLIRLSWQRSASEDVPLDVASVDMFEVYPATWSGGVLAGVTPRYRIEQEALRLFRRRMPRTR